MPHMWHRKFTTWCWAGGILLDFSFPSFIPSRLPAHGVVLAVFNVSFPHCLISLEMPSPVSQVTLNLLKQMMKTNCTHSQQQKHKAEANRRATPCGCNNGMKRKERSRILKAGTTKSRQKRENKLNKMNSTRGIHGTIRENYTTRASRRIGKEGGAKKR